MKFYLSYEDRKLILHCVDTDLVGYHDKVVVWKHPFLLRLRLKLRRHLLRKRHKKLARYWASNPAP